MHCQKFDISSLASENNTKEIPKEVSRIAIQVSKMLNINQEKHIEDLFTQNLTQNKITLIEVERSHQKHLLIILIFAVAMVVAIFLSK